MNVLDDDEWTDNDPSPGTGTSPGDGTSDATTTTMLRRTTTGFQLSLAGLPMLISTIMSSL